MKWVLCGLLSLWTHMLHYWCLSFDLLVRCAKQFWRMNPISPKGTWTSEFGSTDSSAFIIKVSLHFTLWREHTLETGEILWCHLYEALYETETFCIAQLIRSFIIHILLYWTFSVLFFIQGFILHWCLIFIVIYSHFSVITLPYNWGSAIAHFNIFTGSILLLLEHLFRMYALFI